MMNRKDRRGVTLVELAVVVVIIGVLAAFGMPRFINSVERSKAAEAFSYLSTVRSAQERYLAREGVYATNPTQLDIDYNAMIFFTQTPITVTENSWTMTLTRTGASAGYGAYTITFTQDGYDGANSTIDGHPAINPLGIGMPISQD